ncbi:unnamed protein product [Linum tenue]|uniref:Uncharacterized protein n=1 Tax=Linum tenue TaxID=586396 RepID=A0AAV0RA01_9ROSI|nr:unnamed protein product [Linum tenue]
MIKILNSSKEETQAKSAFALAGIFETRKDLRESSIAVKAQLSVMKLLNVESESILAESSHCLAAIFLSVKENRDVAAVARDVLSPLVAHANSSSALEVTEQATCALANLLLDGEVSEKAVSEEIILPATRVLREGTISGKTHAAAAIARLLHSRQIDYAVTDCVNRAGTVLALVSFLESANGGPSAVAEALEALAILSRSNETAGGQIRPAWAVLAEFPESITPIVSSIADATPLLQDKAIEILSRLCRDQSVVLGETVATASGCIASVAKRVINSKSGKVKIGGAALLICAAKYSHQRVVEDLNQSNSCIYLIQSLVAMVTSAEASPSQNDDDENECISICRTSKVEGENGGSTSQTCMIHGYNLAIWLLSVLACHDEKSKIVILEAGAVEAVTDRISNCYLLYNQVYSVLTSSHFTFSIDSNANLLYCACLICICRVSLVRIEAYGYVPYYLQFYSKIETSSEHTQP